MRHKTRRRRIRNLFNRKRIKNAYSFKKMRLVRGGNWFSDFFAENQQRKELIETEKNKYLSSHLEPLCPPEYLNARSELLRNPAYFHMDYPRRSREPRNAENIEADTKRKLGAHGRLGCGKRRGLPLDCLISINQSNSRFSFPLLCFIFSLVSYPYSTFCLES